jgi:hypothetical protein
MKKEAMHCTNAPLILLLYLWRLVIVSLPAPEAAGGDQEAVLYNKVQHAPNTFLLQSSIGNHSCTDQQHDPASLLNHTILAPPTTTKLPDYVTASQQKLQVQNGDTPFSVSLLSLKQ